ncbi:MAG: DUF2029 domain-containing protein [Flavipsychrobacter sp.]|nr:DUF2029 domain-containing protein [Flavipsychrobacter sp.]
MRRISAFLFQHRVLLALYSLAAVGVSIQLVLRGHTHLYVPGGQSYTFYNNYIIFKESFFNLIGGRDLYILYPDRQWDLYKYSPTFALAMGGLAYLPDVVGLAAWNLLNALALLFGVRALPLADRRRAGILLFVFIELVTSMQNAQSNGLLAGCLLLAATRLQRGSPGWAALWLVAGTFIKVYGAIGFCLFLFYPGKLKFLLYAMLWMVIFALVPLLVTGPDMLLMQYHSWARMMAEDQSASFGLSVMGWLHSWFGLGSAKNIVTALGILLFFAPLLRVKWYKAERFRLLFLAHMLVWVVIFNHKAESPTFIIAMTGIALWYFAQQPARWRTALLWIAFIGISLTPTDIFPPAIRKEYLVPYAIKAIPGILVWCIIVLQLMIQRKEPLSLQ